MLLCVTTALCYCSHLLVNVTLPLFVTDLGGSPVVAGLIITGFSVTSFILRPLAGHLTDSWSARGTLFWGAAILSGGSAVLAIPSLWACAITSAVRGVGWGATNTAGSAAVALIAPIGRRGEASGHFSLATTVATTFAPALALWLLSETGQFTVVFAVSAAAGLLAALATYLMPRIGTGTATFREALSFGGAPLSLSSFIDRPVLLASTMLLCMSLTQPITFAFVPLHARAIGIENIGLYFIAVGMTSIVARLLSGHLLDRGSRGLWIVAGYSVMLLAFLAFIQADRVEWFIVAAIFTGLGHSLAQPSLLALAMDRADRAHMGKAMATYSMSYRVGEGLGAPLAGGLIVLFGYSGMYLGGTVCMAAGLLLAILNWRVVGQPIASSPTGRA